MTATVTRRTMLAGAATGLATLATVAPSPSLAAPAPTVPELIEAHRAAVQVLAEATARHTAALAEFERNSCVVPIVRFEDGTEGEWMEFRTHTSHELREIIARRHAELLRIHCSPMARRLSSPATIEAVKTGIFASHHRASENLDRIIAAEAERREASGLNAALDAVDAAEEKVCDAVAALILCRPANADERAAKRQYLRDIEAQVFEGAISIVAEIITIRSAEEPAHA